MTGGTGLIGQALVPRLRVWAEGVDLLSRTVGGQGDRVTCDLRRWDGGIPAGKLNALHGRYGCLVHLAALYDPRSAMADAYTHTILGTQTALTLAAKLGIPHFFHLSTVAVALGDDYTPAGAPYPTDRLSVDRAFPDSYAYSKAHAEAMVRQWTSGVDCRTICRLGIVVGDTEGNPPARFDGPYYAADGLSRVRNLLRAAPGPLPLVGHGQVRLPLVPLDIASRALDRLIQLSVIRPVQGISCFHLTPQQGVALGEFYRFILDKLELGGRQIHFTNNLPHGLQKRLVDLALGIPKEELEYSLHLPRFESTATRALLGQGWCPEFGEYQDAFWKGYRLYAENRGA